MTKSVFNLQAALDKLHEEDWLHPEEKTFRNTGQVEESEKDRKYRQKSYWIAQFSHLLINQFHQSHRACARILKQPSHKSITRAMARFPECDFSNLSEVKSALTIYSQEQGVR
ncbi:hypothetical protein [Weissella paramesenteroides]|uniref:hypothetical protein n=1 Tax=Weissella paramesenteroides TaxID=1249 RepID=UPI0013DD6C1F|nr:hypothetical protein [Weissella paramesenteroides]NEZ89067.1 hypothetical protein [Weissella paramesenteroides]NFB03392.1 hypothetical protein [Weissella paramesenteroides]